MSECQTKAGNQECFGKTFTTFTTFTLLFTLSRHVEQLLISCLCSKVTLSLSHSLTLKLSHSRTLALSLSHSLIHSLSRHAEQLLFSCLCSKVTVYSRKLQCFFWDILIITLTCYFTCHRAGSQLKI